MDQQITPVFIGFQASDLDTIILRAYIPNDNYLHLVDTSIIDRASNLTSYLTSGDTTWLFFIDHPNINLIGPRYDWQIYLPISQKTITISGISSPQNDCTCSCGNPINSFSLDGQNVAAVSSYSYGWNYYGAYIQNN